MNALKPVNMEYLDNQQRKGTKNNENCQHLHVKKTATNKYAPKSFLINSNRTSGHNTAQEPDKAAIRKLQLINYIRAAKVTLPKPLVLLHHL